MVSWQTRCGIGYKTIVFSQKFDIFLPNMLYFLLNN